MDYVIKKFGVVDGMVEVVGHEIVETKSVEEYEEEVRSWVEVMREYVRA